jgi:hypothetical protein
MFLTPSILNGFERSLVRWIERFILVFIIFLRAPNDAVVALQMWHPSRQGQVTTPGDEHAHWGPHVMALNNCKFRDWRGPGKGTCTLRRNRHFPAPDNMWSEVTDSWLSNEPKRIPAGAADQKIWCKQCTDLRFCLFRVNHCLFGTNEVRLAK